MVDVDQKLTRNRLLAQLSHSDFDLLAPHLEPVQCRLRDVLIEADAPIERVFFPEDLIASVVAITSESRIEVGLVGREGLVGASVALGVGRVPFRFLVQLAGNALVVPVAQFRTAIVRSPPLLELIGRYIHVLSVQTAGTAYANASFQIEARLARWILMTHDRLDGDELWLTHEFMSMMLGVRRAGITEAALFLEKKGYIQGVRGRITVLDRVALRNLAAGSYGVPEAEYEALIAPRSTLAYPRVWERDM
jgi:CRP-like cAMP-binding protein